MLHTSYHAASSGSSTALLDSSLGTWIIDSGPSTHMLGTASFLSHLQALPNPESITIANGHLCLVVKKGLAAPTSSISLSNVLYIPHFLVNLLSVSAITKVLFCTI